MIQYFYKSLRMPEVSELGEPKPGSWVHVEAPTPEEIEQLTERFKLEAGHLQDALDEDEQPRLEREGDQTYMFVRYAYKTDDDVNTAPLLLMFDKDVLLTVSPRHLPAVDKLLQGLGMGRMATTQRAKLILLILSNITDQYDTHIAQTSRRIKVIRSRLRSQGLTNKDLIDFVLIEDQLNEFLASLLPTNATLRRLLAGRQLPLFEEDQDIVEDLLLSNEQSIETSRSNLKSISNIRDAYSAIISNNLNRTITWLTLATILIALPNVFFGMYGMNVKLPGQDSADAFAVIALFNLLLIVTILIFARRKRLV